MAAADNTVNQVISSESKWFYYCTIDEDGYRCIELSYIGKTLSSERNAMEILELCAETGITRLIIHGELLEGDFSKPKTGLAEILLYKFFTYQVYAAIVTDEYMPAGKIRDTLIRSKSVRLCSSTEEARAWLKLINAI